MTYIDQLLLLPLQQTLHRNPSSPRNHTRNITRRHTIMQQPTRICQRILLILRRKLTLELGDGGEAQLGGVLVSAFALCDFELVFRVGELLFEGFECVEAGAFWDDSGKMRRFDDGVGSDRTDLRAMRLCSRLLWRISMEDYVHGEYGRTERRR